MEACKLLLRGENATEFADEFVAAKADERRHSLNMRGVRNIHTYESGPVTQVVYERAAVRDPSWLMVSLLVEELDEESCRLALFVGGGGEGPFKLEEMSVPRLIRGEEDFGESGRFGTVIEDVREVAGSLGLDVEPEWPTVEEKEISEKMLDKATDSERD